MQIFNTKWKKKENKLKNKVYMRYIGTSSSNHKLKQELNVKNDKHMHMYIHEGITGHF
jgi:hypothetical protein